jgi:2-polyprenyl-6-methoxyphenol hydroxylase-like FAD-dependent oxidoreductase
VQNDVATQTEKPEQTEETTCCIVGSGPAGAVLALLLARKGIPVMLLEEHMDSLQSLSAWDPGLLMSNNRR